MKEDLHLCHNSSLCIICLSVQLNWKLLTLHHSTFLHSLASGNIYNNGFSHLISSPDGAETRHLTVRHLLALPGSLLRYSLCQLQMRTPAYPRLPNPPPGSDRARRPQVASVPVADLKVNHRLTLSLRFPLCLEQH